jgi:hypothetical protein
MVGNPGTENPFAIFPGVRGFRPAHRGKDTTAAVAGRRPGDRVRFFMHGERHFPPHKNLNITAVRSNRE